MIQLGWEGLIADQDLVDLADLAGLQRFGVVSLGVDAAELGEDPVDKGQVVRGDPDAGPTQLNGLDNRRQGQRGVQRGAEGCHT